MNNDMPPLPESPLPVPQSSLAARLTNIFVSPGEVFEEIRTSPACVANWIAPALIFLVASWGAAALMFTQPAIRQQLADVQDQAIQRQFQKQIDAGKMTQAQVDQFKANAEKFAGFGKIIGGAVGPLFGVGLFLFGGGFVIWAGAMFVFKQPFEFMKAVEVCGLALVIVAVGALVKGLLCAGMGSMFAGPSPALLIKQFDPSNLIHNSLAALDVFGLWALVVKSIGLAKLGRISVVKASAWVFGAWIVITGGLLMLSWGAQKLFSSMSGAH